MTQMRTSVSVVAVSDGAAAKPVSRTTSPSSRTTVVVEGVAAGPQCRALGADGQGRPVGRARGDGMQEAVGKRLGEVGFGVAGFGVGGRRRQPRLDDAQFLAGEVAGGVQLRMADAVARRNVLRHTRFQGRLGAGGAGDGAAVVAVAQRAVHDPGDQLDVAVLVHVEALAGRDDVVVVHHEQPEGVALHVEVPRRGERLARQQRGIAPRRTLGGADDAHFGPRLFRNLIR